jgi:hypothetical protein
MSTPTRPAPTEATRARINEGTRMNENASDTTGRSRTRT